MRITRLIFLISLLAQSILSQTGLANHFLQSTEEHFFQANDQTRIGIEVEFKGLSPRQAAEIIRESLGGNIQTREEEIKTAIDSYLSTGSPIYQKITLQEFEIVGTKIGTILIKPETNQIDDFQILDNLHQVVELVTEPIRYPEVEKLDYALENLKKAGAIGTDAQTAVSTQINVELFEGRKEDFKISQLLNLLKIYLNPKNSEQILTYLKVPNIRIPYIASYSPGFMKKLLDPSYSPHLREFYDDFIYRQSLELLGDPSAWTAPIQSVKNDLLNHTNPVVPQVVKQNKLRISSLLMWMIPEDPMSQLYQKTGWAVARPLVEFREWNNDFNATQPTRQVLGLKASAKDLGTNCEMLFRIERIGD